MNITPQNKNLVTARYFDDLEAKIVSRIHAEAATQRSRAELVRSTGVEDPELAVELSKLGITADELIAVRFFPLVLVAWAEDHADLEEQEVVKAQAAELGISEDSTAWMILDSWLQKRPPGIGVDAWRRYTHDILSQMSPSAAKRLIKLTEKQMTKVAKASGGLLGFGKVSKKESTMIRRLIETMRKQAGLA